MTVRGIRGAISVDRNDSESIRDATQRLLRAMLAANAIETQAIISVIFSATADLTALFPALAARAIGFQSVPMLHCTELSVDGAMERVIRVLMHVATGASQGDVKHVYLDKAVALRPDLEANAGLS